jgi:glutathione peroxidase
MMAKISVKEKDIASVYNWLTKKSENGKEDAKVSWNFQKFLIDEDGNWAGTFSPKTSPMSEDIISWIKGKK